VEERINLLYLLVFANFFLTFQLMNDLYGANPIQRLFTVLLGIAAMLYGILLVISSFKEKKEMKKH
jgi:uncharacterized membrane protein YuzA (DUF378 family)